MNKFSDEARRESAIEFCKLTGNMMLNREGLHLTV